MTIKLVVTNQFADYARGDQITDPALVAELRDSHNAGNVVAVSVPDQDATSAPAAA